MDSFLNKIANEIAEKYEDPKDLCFVLPSQRAGTFLKQALAKNYHEIRGHDAIQLPTVKTLDDFVVDLSALTVLDKLSAFFKLFDTYQVILKEENEKTESVDEFINWAPTLLADFNEIDKYTVNSMEIFSYINDVRAMETWNIDGKPLTEHQVNYLKLWKRFGKLYHAFKKQTLAEKETYIGLIFREVAENIEGLYQNTKYEHLIFAGFNALSKSEETIISQFIKTKKASIYWDADNYYLQDENQEAGYFLRKFKKNWSFSEFKWPENHFKSGTKNIKIHNCNTNYAQSILAADILSQNTDAELNTALVLNKEDLLLPVLNALPDNVLAANITMGYELKLTPLSSFVNILLDLWYSKTGKEKNAFYYKNVIQFLEHNYTELLISNKQKLVSLKKDIIKFNKIYVGTRFIFKYLDDNPLIKTIFSSENQDLADNTQKILTVLAKLKDTLSDASSNKYDKSLQIEFVYHYTLVFRKLHQTIQNNPVIRNSSLKVFRLLINQLVNKEKVSFYGEPLKGIQIMGMLESRALDFEHVIIMSVNEGVLPAGKKNHSFIPYDLKREFGLPTHTEHDAIFANHFYRLMQRATTIDILYHTGSDDFGAGTEKSRFIEQIIHELPKYNKNIHITTSEYNPVPSISDKVKHLPKSDELLSRIKAKLKKGLSPSAMNTLASCNMNFYYRYLVGLGELEEVEESIKSSTLGTCIHDTLENLHKLSLGTPLDETTLKNYKKLALTFLEKEFLKYFSEKDLKTGNNLLTFEVAKNYVNKFLNYELEIIKKDKYTVVQVEDNIAHELMLEIEDETIATKIHGKVDVISQIGEKKLLLDYKTGKVESKELNFKDISQFYAGSKKKAKALQLLTYAWVYYQENPETEHISPCIYSFKNSKAGFMYLKYNNKIISKSDVLELFPQVVQVLVNNLMNKKTDLKHSEDSLYCEYCL
ncbi:MAG: ATP-dependent helicase/nuclease subunit B [Saprospiraceae bacterium]|jgi:ATP-dependent helicase/nuclease subunit B